jgi:predicted outer membrane repeat protein
MCGNSSAVGGLLSGGAIVMQASAAPKLRNTTFALNVAGNNGGAISIQNRAGATFDDCYFINNSADNGGGVAVTDISTANFTRCNITSMNKPSVERIARGVVWARCQLSRLVLSVV